mmetsp:Transcript_30594/g.67185  ORF Transcript_30594/g.67185 Transcript_30594/m.67185 type:complete len:362 (+) Transcript_30594:1044-2129(+)
MYALLRLPFHLEIAISLLARAERIFHGLLGVLEDAGGVEPLRVVDPPDGHQLPTVHGLIPDQGPSAGRGPGVGDPGGQLRQDVQAGPVVVIRGHGHHHEAGGVRELAHALLEGHPHRRGSVGVVAVAHPALDVRGELLPDLFHAHLHPREQSHLDQIHKSRELHSEPKPSHRDRHGPEHHLRPAPAPLLRDPVHIEHDPGKICAPRLDGPEDEVVQLAPLRIPNDPGVLASADTLLLLPPPGEPVAHEELEVLHVAQADPHRHQAQEQGDHQQPHQRKVGRDKLVPGEHTDHHQALHTHIQEIQSELQLEALHFGGQFLPLLLHGDQVQAPVDGRCGQGQPAHPLARHAAGGGANGLPASR